jgi:hypothetical protein
MKKPRSAINWLQGRYLEGWAREELNLRPHAYQDGDARQPASASVNQRQFLAASVIGRQPASTSVNPRWHHFGTTALARRDAGPAEGAAALA